MVALPIADYIRLTRLNNRDIICNGNRHCISFPARVRRVPGWEKIWRRIFRPRDRSLKKLMMRWAFAISRLCFEGPAEDLQLTENTQPAILTVSVAAFRAHDGSGDCRAGICRGTQFG